MNESSGEKLPILQLFQDRDEAFRQYFDPGDPEATSWFLVKQNAWPFLLCVVYVLLAKMTFAIIRNRKALELRKPMILFNLFLVTFYTTASTAEATNLIPDSQMKVMANFVERKPFNIIGMFDGLEDYLNTGDPIVKEWLLVKSNFWPIFLCIMYLVTVKIIGPSIMRDKKPFTLRKTMIVYNLILVAAYFTCVSVVIYGMTKTDLMTFCKNTIVKKGEWTYIMASAAWVIYILKYIEFLDTIFFILRKKDNLITNLHVIHHAALPVIGWICFRTERSGFQAFPVIINSVIHIAMYSYYGLAAMGPNVRKYLWWKRYLTIAQMIQFVLIIFFVIVVMPLTGCSAAKTSVSINIVGALLFLALFYNFYKTTFSPQKKSEVCENSNGATKTENIQQNGYTNRNAVTNGKSKIKSN